MFQSKFPKQSATTKGKQIYIKPFLPKSNKCQWKDFSHPNTPGKQNEEKQRKQNTYFYGKMVTQIKSKS